MAVTATVRRAAGALYGAYAWLALAVAVLPVLAGLLVVPGVLRRRRIARWGARLWFRLCGIAIDVAGPPVPEGHSVVVANHASYLDGILLTAVLPARYTFLIKAEMARVPVASFVLRRLGSEFVDRQSHGHRHRTARRLVGAARDGNSLAFFPEGTFDGAPGLKRFQIGAFAAAHRAGLAVVPTVITGTRDALPARRWLVRPRRLGVTYCGPLPGDEFESARELLATTRRALLARLGEPDLSPETSAADAGDAWRAAGEKPTSYR